MSPIISGLLQLIQLPVDSDQIDFDLGDGSVVIGVRHYSIVVSRRLFIGSPFAASSFASFLLSWR